MHYSFFISVHARPSAVTAGDELRLSGLTVRALRVAPDMLSTATFACSFEEACARIAELERMYCEPDGSFVWVSPQGESTWQVDGNLYDRSERLLFVDLKGTCPPDQFDRLLSALGWPETPLVFQLTREAVFLDETEFRRFASSDVTA